MLIPSVINNSISSRVHPFTISCESQTTRNSRYKNVIRLDFSSQYLYTKKNQVNIYEDSKNQT